MEEINDLARLRLLAAVDGRLQELLDRQDGAVPLRAQPRSGGRT